MWKWLTTGVAESNGVNAEPYRADDPAPAVAVSLKTGSTLLGVLILHTDDALVIRGGILVGVDRNQAETREPLDGDTIVPLINIDFWQTGIDPMLVTRIEE